MTQIVSFERAALLLKKEVTYGLDPVPVPATDGMLIQNGRIRFQANKLVREVDRAFFGGRPFVLTGRTAFIEFDFELMGAAVVGDAAPIAPVLLATAHAETLTLATSATYNPVSSGFDSATGYFTIPSPNASGATRHVVTGLMGSTVITAQINNFARGRAVLQGQEAILSDNAFPAVTLTNFQAPVGIDNSTWSVTADDGGGAFALDCVELQLDSGNRQRQYETSEQQIITIVERDAQGFLRIHDTALVDFDAFALAKAGTNVNIQSVITGGAGKIFTLSIPKAQLDLPERIDIDGASGLRIPFSAIPSDTGNDEYELIFT